MMERLSCLSISLPGASPKSLEEALALRESLLHAESNPLMGCEGGIGLSTCARFEYYEYAPVTDSPSRQIIDAVVHDSRAVCSSQSSWRHYSGRSACRHLFRVASGLESRILGEPQILSQVRKAYLAALERRAVGPVLDAVMRSAIHAGRRVRSETTLGRTAVSYASYACEALDRILHAPGNIVILGTGALARDVSRIAMRRGDTHITIVSRHIDRALELAASTGGSARPREELIPALAEADALIACTNATHPVVTPEVLPARKRPLLVLDLGVPPNVDRSVVRLAGVQLLFLDQLIPAGPCAAPDVDLAERIIEEEVDRFREWTVRREVARMWERSVRLPHHHWAGATTPYSQRREVTAA